MLSCYILNSFSLNLKNLEQSQLEILDFPKLPLILYGQYNHNAFIIILKQNPIIIFNSDEEEFKELLEKLLNENFILKNERFYIYPKRANKR